MIRSHTAACSYCIWYLCSSVTNISFLTLDSSIINWCQASTQLIFKSLSFHKKFTIVSTCLPCIVHPNFYQMSKNCIKDCSSIDRFMPAIACWVGGLTLSYNLQSVQKFQDQTTRIASEFFKRAFAPKIWNTMATLSIVHMCTTAIVNDTGRNKSWCSCQLMKQRTCFTYTDMQ